MKRVIRASITRWQDKLPDDVYDRLNACRSRYRDIPVIAKAKYESLVAEGNPEGKDTAEAAVDYTLEHLAANDQFFDPSRKEYTAWVHSAMR